MSRFYAEIQGNRGMASRQGHPSSGIWGHIRGWRCGVKVTGTIVDNEDVFYVYATTGSGGGFYDKLVGKVRLNGDGEPEWVPAK